MPPDCLPSSIGEWLNVQLLGTLYLFPIVDISTQLAPQIVTKSLLKKALFAIDTPALAGLICVYHLISK